MSHIGFHPAPGFGELLPGNFVVPHNPITPASYVPRIGELLPGRFVLPENPVARELSGYSSLRPNGPRNVTMSGLAGGCGCIAGMCGESCEGLGGMGMGQLGLDAVMPFLPWILGGGLVLWMLSRPGGKGYREDRERAETQYRSTVAGIKSKHRGYRRVARGAVSGVKRGAAAVAGKSRAVVSRGRLALAAG